MGLKKGVHLGEREWGGSERGRHLEVGSTYSSYYDERDLMSLRAILFAFLC